MCTEMSSPTVLSLQGHILLKLNRVEETEVRLIWYELEYCEGFL